MKPEISGNEIEDFDIIASDELLGENIEDFTREDESGKEFVMPEEDAKSAIEAILFAAGDPISLEKISSVLGYDKERTQRIIGEMIYERNSKSRKGLIIRQLDDTFTLSTNPELSYVLKRLFTPRNRPPITQAAYETLAIIAYNQPVTRSQVESVRGVSSDSIITRLIEKNLIQECGTLDAPGRPVLFETTELFLKEFGLSTVRELPPIDMIMYGTLRDFESSISNVSAKDQDNQVTIDQIVDTRRKENESYAESSEPGKVDPDEIITISNALFGETQE